MKFFNKRTAGIFFSRGAYQPQRILAASLMLTGGFAYIAYLNEWKMPAWVSPKFALWHSSQSTVAEAEENKKNNVDPYARSRAKTPMANAGEAVVVGGSSNQELAKRVAEHLGTSLA
jgi:hypothetical protein